MATKKVGAATKKAATTTAATKKAAATTKAGTAMQAAPTTTAPRVRSTASGRKTAVDDDPIVFFADSAAFEAWLAAHHDRSSGVWLQHSKKGATRPSVSYAEALDVALCWGWIDGQKRSHDDESFLQRFSPRGPRSIWSVINRDKVDALIAAGRMRPAGQRVVDDAKRDGRWDAAYASARTATVPDDLQAALDQVPAAAAFFAGLKQVAEKGRFGPFSATLLGTSGPRLRRGRINT